MRAGEVMALGAGAGALAEGGLVLGSTVWGLHRELSHRAMQNPDLVSAFMYVATQPFTDAKTWAFIHRYLHHQLTDGNLGPFVEMADRIDYGPGELRADIPDEYANQDRGARNISFERRLQIGRIARPLVAGWYEPRTEYTPEDDERILGDKALGYRYTNLGPAGDPRVEPDGPYRLEDVMWRLRDPHAPDLHPRGVRGILREGNNLYHVPERSPLFEEMMPSDLQRTEWEEQVHAHNEELMKVFISSNIALGALSGAVLNRRSRLVGAAQGILAGGGAATGTAGILLKGSELVNGMGHAGGDPYGALLKDNLIPNPDGTYATDGNVLLSLLTMDEAGLQGEHHRSPWLIAFTKERGLRGLITAPVGKMLEALIRADIGFSVGQGFPGEDPRPDEAHEAILMLQEERVATLEKDSPAYNLTEMLAERFQSGTLRECVQLLRMSPEQLAAAA